MSSAYASSTTTVTTATTTTSSSSKSSKFTKSSNSSKAPKAPLVSSGRGGSGNKRPKSALKLDLGDEAEILRKRRLEASLNPRVKVKYTGRGGSGNIRAASEAQSIPFDISADPDDDYERIVLQGAQNAKKDKLPSTGRGGLGNLHRPRAKSFLGASATPKGKKEKPRRRRSASSSSRFTISSSSVEHFELQRLVSDTSGLSLDIPNSRPTSAPQSSSSLPTPPASSPTALYRLSTTSTTTSLPASSSRAPWLSSSSPPLLSVVATTGVQSAPSSPLRSNRHISPDILLSDRNTTTSGSAQNLPTQDPHASQSTPSLFLLPPRASTSSLGLLSPPASPITSEDSPIVTGERLSVSVEEPNLNSTPPRLHVSRSHATASKWWKMGGRRRLKGTAADTMSEECLVVSSPDVSPEENPVPLHNATSEQQTMTHLQEVGMHAMEVRMRMREERLSIIRNSQRAAPPQLQELDDSSDHVADSDGQESDRNDVYPLPSVPEEEDVGYVSFLDFQ